MTTIPTFAGELPHRGLIRWLVLVTTMAIGVVNLGSVIWSALPYVGWFATSSLLVGVSMAVVALAHRVGVDVRDNQDGNRPLVGSRQDGEYHHLDALKGGTPCS